MKADLHQPQQIKLRFVPVNEETKDLVVSIGKKHLLDLTLKVRKCLLLSRRVILTDCRPPRPGTVCFVIWKRSGKVSKRCLSAWS